MKRLAISVGAASVLALVAVTPATANGLRADPIRRVRAGNARNWAGYVAHGGPFTSAATSWVEPSITCGSTDDSALAVFAGIDGSGSSTVEQIGTLDICKKGAVQHNAFFEMFPRAAFNIGKPVRAGDSLTASVVNTARRKFTLTLTNHTQGWTFSTIQRSRNAQLASAEAIAEAPTMRRSGIVALANFGTVNFGGTTANGQALGNFNPEAVTMVTAGGATMASPSGISGGSFSVAWQHS